MAKKLVIVESPAKARTIKSFLGGDYEVMASIGHIRDLAENKKDLPADMQKQWWADYSVDLDKDFEPYYVVPAGKKEQVRKLKDALKSADALFLATDEDREGESISWHLLEVLRPKKGIEVNRVAFHEITREAIQNAFRNPRKLDDDLVRAQEARRILDRLYGYTLSPVLWRMGRGRGLSAGRVQTPAVKLIVEREMERKEFVSAEYWGIEAHLKSGSGTFVANLIEVDAKRLVAGADFDPKTGLPKDDKKLWLRESDASSLATSSKSATPWTVNSVESKPEQRRPYAPFMTSSLQQEANRKLGFGADRTMRLAQDLYEGLDGVAIEGGLITYMRTDSLELSAEAIKQARALIGERFGKEYLPEKPNRYKSKVSNAQEAHEAIRPTNFALTPEDLAKRLSSRYSDHVRLYELIWKRAVASQMPPAQLTITTVLVGVKSGINNLTFSSSGKSIVFPGFLRAYVEGSDDPEAALEDQEKLLPPLKTGETVVAQEVTPTKHATRPPARYTEASLVKALEERGIGRPSTYAAIIRTIVDREYVRIVKKELIPTFMAFLVVNVLDQHFAEFSDLNFTAEMDQELDDIANGREDWKRYLRSFFFGDAKTPGLKPLVDERSGEIRRPVFLVGSVNEVPISVLFGRNGFFLSKGEGEEAKSASVPEEIAPADLTVEKAEELFEARASGGADLGIDPVTGRRLLLKQKGGYYLEAERTKEEIADKVKPRWISLPPGVPPSDLTEEEVHALCLLPKEIGRSGGTPVTAKMGKYGAYVECGAERRTVEDWRKLLAISLEEAEALLAAPKTGRSERPKTPAVIAELGEHDGAEGPIRVMNGRFGPYVTDGTTNATLPRGTSPEGLSAERAAELIAAKRAAGPSKRPARFAKRKTTTTKKKTTRKK